MWGKERLKDKTEASTRLAYTGLRGGHLNIETKHTLGRQIFQLSAFFTLISEISEACHNGTGHEVEK